MSLSNATNPSPALPGFDPEFTDLDSYIRVITARIWEGRQIHRIHQYYSADCAVITPGGTSQGVQAVVQGTLDTLQQFPDRRLLCEDIVSAGDATQGFLSSHRIFSTMTHLGAGRFGPASGRTLQVRTVADCVCLNNRIVHEWLVRDQGAIALQLGGSPQALARDWLTHQGSASPPLWQPPPPVEWNNPQHETPGAAVLARCYRDIWTHQLNALQDHADDAIALCLPNGQSGVGVAAAEAFWLGYTAAFNGAELTIDSLAERIEPGRTPRVAMRWRVTGVHRGNGRFGPATHKLVEILGITHAEVDHTRQRILREWVLIDEVALWMQLLSP